MGDGEMAQQFSRGLGFKLQHPHGGSQPSVILLLGNSKPPAGTKPEDIYVGKTPMYTG